MSFSLSKWHLFNVEMTSSPIHVFFSSLTKIIFLCIFSFKKANFTFLSPHNMCSTKKCHPVLFHTFVLFFLIASLYQVDFWLVSQLNRSWFTGYFQFMYPWAFLFFRHIALALLHCFIAFMIKTYNRASTDSLAWLWICPIFCKIYTSIFNVNFAKKSPYERADTWITPSE